MCVCVCVCVYIYIYIYISLFLLYCLHLFNFIRGGKLSVAQPGLFIPPFSTENKRFNK